MLDKEHKAELNRVVLKIASILKKLDNIPADPRVFDLLEVSASLLEQQIEQNVVYEIMLDEDFEENAMPASKLIEPGEYQQSAQGDEELKEYDTSGFLFLDSNGDIPTPQELDEWFNQPFPYEDYS